MRPLTRLLLSDARRMWRQGVALSVLLGCGIATFTMSMSSMHSIKKSMRLYYAESNFGDVFVSLTRAPNSLRDRLLDIPGVDRVETRVVHGVTLNVPGMVEPASCQMLSIRDGGNSGLNRVFLLRGRMPDPLGGAEVLVSEQFADSHGFKPGDELSVVMAGKKKQLRISGIAMSPEFVYVVQPGMLLTDNRRFGIVWMPHRQMETAFNMKGAFNDAVLTLRSKASTKDVLFRVDQLTEPYGGLGAYDRSDQASHHRVADELQQMSSMALVTPTIFLVVATFLFNLVFSRMVRQQQEQIATLRAFGYRASEVGFYYAKLVLLFVSAGVLIGCIGGIRLSWWMISEYVRFFRFPIVVYEFAIDEALLAAIAAVGAALIGSYSSIQRAVRLPPAVAMRPESPSHRGRSVAERLGLGFMLSPMTRMIVRRLENNKRSTALSVLGLAMGLAVLVLGSFFEGTIDHVVEVQFERSQRQDIMLTFGENLSPSSLHDVSRLPGVEDAEVFRSVPVRMRHGSKEHRVAIMGLDEKPRLFRVLDASQEQVTLPPVRGVTISEKLAQILGVSTGENVLVEVMEGKRQRLQVPVTSVFPDYASPAAYMNRLELHRLLREGERYSGAFLAIDKRQLADLYEEVKGTPVVMGVLDKNAAHANFVKTISENTYVMRYINYVFASIIAFGVIYNCALITLSERSRDLATLRVMGFTRKEISVVLLGELAIITLLAIPFGMLIGYGFAYLATLALDTETHRFPLIVGRTTFAEATLTLLVAATVSSLLVRRLLDRLDLLAVLKVKE